MRLLFLLFAAMACAVDLPPDPVKNHPVYMEIDKIMAETEVRIKAIRESAMKIEPLSGTSACSRAKAIDWGEWAICVSEDDFQIVLNATTAVLLKKLKATLPQESVEDIMNSLTKLTVETDLNIQKSKALLEEMKPTSDEINVQIRQTKPLIEQYLTSLVEFAHHFNTWSEREASNVCNALADNLPFVIGFIVVACTIGYLYDGYLYRKYFRLCTWVDKGGYRMSPLRRNGLIYASCDILTPRGAILQMKGDYWSGQLMIHGHAGNGVCGALWHGVYEADIGYKGIMVDGKKERYQFHFKPPGVKDDAKFTDERALHYNH